MFGSYGRKKRSALLQHFDNSTYANNSLSENSQEKLSATIRVFAEGEEVVQNVPKGETDEDLQRSMNITSDIELTV